ncbi:MAG: hypothetical protein ACR2IE_14245 [Candidatus Sumerlaeaceae bacterium]
MFTIFRLACITLAGVAITSTSMAALTLSDGFNYTDNTALTANGWTAHSGATLNPVTAKNTSNLTYPGATPLTGAAGASFGHRFASSEDVNRNMGALTTTDGSTIYASFLFRVDDITAVIAATEATVPFMVDTSVWPLRMYVKSDTIVSTYTLGIRTHRGGGTQPVEHLTTDLTTGTVYKVILGLEFVPGTGNDIAKLWLNPPTGNAVPPAPNVQQSETTADTIPTMFAIRQGSSQRMTMSIDDIRVSNTWSEVNPSPARVEEWSLF